MSDIVVQVGGPVVGAVVSEGPPGLQGPQGATGPQGPSGVTGPQGPSGPSQVAALARISLGDYASTSDSPAAITSAFNTVHAQALSTNKRIFIPDGTWTVNANLAVIANIEVEGLLEGDVPHTITFSGGFEAPPKQIFTANITPVFADQCQVKRLYVEWAGAKGNGISISPTCTSGSTQVDITQGGLTSTVVGRTAVLYDQTTPSQVFLSTVASVDSSTRFQMASPSSITMASPRQGFILSDGDEVAIRKMIVASRGAHTIEFLPHIYSIGANFSIAPTTGRGPKLRGNRASLVATAADVSLLSFDPQSNSAVNVGNCVITEFDLYGANLAKHGLLGGNVAFPSQPAAFSGKIDYINIYAVQERPWWLEGCQSTIFSHIKSTYSGKAALLSGCNGTSFIECIPTNVQGSGEPGWDIDSSSNGGGEVHIYGGGAEQIASGPGVRVKDSTGTGTQVHLQNMHQEAVGTDGFDVYRQATQILGGVVSGSGSYSPVRVRSTAHGTEAFGIVAAGFSSMAPVLETGVKNTKVQAVFNTVTKTYTDPKVSDGWSGNAQIKYSSGDFYTKGKQGLGTFAPRESIEVVSGGVLLDQGAMAVVRGGLITPHGGVGPGQNLLLRSEEFSNASWTKSSCTVTADQVVAPDELAVGGSLADKLVTTTGGFIRQDANVNTLLGYSDISNGGGPKNYGFQVWMRSAKDLTADGTGCSDTTLKCASATFVTDGVPVGSRVYNSTEGVYAYVVSVDSETQLTTTGVGNWTGDSFTAPQRVRLWMTAGGIQTIGNVVDVTVERDWGFFWAVGATSSTSNSTFRCELRSPTSATYTIYAWGAAGYEVTNGNLVPQAYARTLSTARVSRAFGPVQNQLPRPPGGTFTMAAANNLVVSDVRVTANTLVKLFPKSLSAGVLMGSAKSLVQDPADNVAGTSFKVKTGDTNAAVGTETFSYEQIEPWNA